MLRSLQSLKLLSCPKTAPLVLRSFRSCPAQFAWQKAGLSSSRKKSPPASPMAGKRKASASEDGDAPQKSAKTEDAQVHPDRVRSLKEGDVKPGPVIYW